MYVYTQKYCRYLYITTNLQKKSKISRQFFNDLGHLHLNSFRLLLFAYLCIQSANNNNKISTRVPVMSMSNCQRHSPIVPVFLNNFKGSHANTKLVQ